MLPTSSSKAAATAAGPSAQLVEVYRVPVPSRYLNRWSWRHIPALPGRLARRAGRGWRRRKRPPVSGAWTVDFGPPLSTAAINMIAEEISNLRQAYAGQSTPSD